MIGSVQNGPTMPASPCPITLSYTKNSANRVVVCYRVVIVHTKYFGVRLVTKEKPLGTILKEVGGGVCADLWDPLPGSATAFHLSLQELGNGTALIVWFKNN